MTSEVVTIEGTNYSEEALNIAYENKVERLPVLRIQVNLLGLLLLKIF